MNSEPNIADLLRQLRDDTTALIREEVALAKTELGEKAARAGRNSAYLGAGALIASASFLLFLMSLAFLISNILERQDVAQGMALFVGFLLVALIVGVVSAALISKALKAFSNESIKPTRTVQSLREDKQWAQNKIS